MRETVVADVLKHLRYSALRLSNPDTIKLDNIVVPVTATPQLAQLRRRLYSGSYELAERKAVRRLVQPDDTVLEIGAGLGIVTATIASQLRAGGKIVTYEANPVLRQSIEAVACANGFTYEPRVASVGRASGEVEFFINEDAFETSSKVDRGFAKQRKVSVPQHGLQDVFDEVAPTVLVIDIEGAETGVLDWTFPEQLRAICAEFHPHIVGDAAVSRLVENLLRQGYRLMIDLSAERVLVFSR